MAKVSKIMLADVPTLKKNSKVEEAVRLIAKTENGCAVVVEDKSPVGIVTELDIIRRIAAGKLNLKEPISRIMNSPATCMTPDMKLDEALRMIDTKRYRKYPIVENGQLIGLVTKNDVVNAISDNVRLHRAIQNIVLILFVAFELFIFLLYQPLIQYLGA